MSLNIYAFIPVNTLMSILISCSPFGRVPEGKKKVYSIPKGAIHMYQRYICLDVNV